VREVFLGYYLSYFLYQSRKGGENLKLFNWFNKKGKALDYAEQIMAKLDCDCYRIEGNDVQGVMTIYKEALEQGKKEGYTPLIIIPSEMMLEIVDQTANKEYAKDDRETILAKANDIDAKELLERLQEDVIPDPEEDYDITGEFTIEQRTNDFLSMEDKNIILAKIPSGKPWEVAAWVPMGGFNECPLPEEQVAVFKYWYEKYGATPALVTQDVWEFFVERPPHTQEEAERLAWEQFGFCGDIVWQGVGTVNALAGTLIDSSIWYFWWD
jgi:hypothetical protein